MTLGAILLGAAVLLLPPALMLGTFNGLSMLGVLLALASAASVIRSAYVEGANMAGDEGPTG